MQVGVVPVLAGRTTRTPSFAHPAQRKARPVADKSLHAHLTATLEAKQAEAERIAGTFKTEDGKFVISTEQHKGYLKAVNEAKDAKAMLDAAQDADEHREFLSAPEGKSAAGQFYGGTHRQLETGSEVKSLADVFMQSDELKNYREGLAAGRIASSAPVNLHASLEGKSIFSLSGGTITHTTLGTQTDVGIIEAQRRKMHIRDLFPKANTQSNLIWGVRESGWVNNAKQIKERYAADGVSPATGDDTDVFGLAPKSKLILTPTSWPVAEIAHMIDAHKNILADDGRLRNFINTRMIEGVKFAEDYDLLHSVGDGEKITGLFNTPGVQAYNPTGTKDKFSVQIRRAITKSLLAEYEPTGIVLSPTMWEQVEVEEDNQGAFRVATSVAIGATKTVWRLNVVETTAMPDSTYLVGAFGMGAQLYDREAVSVSVSTEHNDNFGRGVVTFRADERCALVTERPESFTIGSWVAPSA
jgi:HK97 family phage major capsid protein